MKKLKPRRKIRDKGWLIFLILLHLFGLIILINGLRETSSGPINFVMVSYKEGNIVFYLSGDYEFSKLLLRNEDFKISPRSGSPRPDNNRSEYWEINNNDMCRDVKCSWKKCEYDDYSRNLSKITYGNVPKCYHEDVPSYKIQKGDLYEVPRSNIPDRYNREHVFFLLFDCRKSGIKDCEKTANSHWRHPESYANQRCKLDEEIPCPNNDLPGLQLRFAGCGDNAEKTCLFTNSPASWDIEDKYKWIMENSLKE